MNVKMIFGAIGSLLFAFFNAWFVWRKGIKEKDPKFYLRSLFVWQGMGASIVMVFLAIFLIFKAFQ
jgi:hypothetical protein